MERRLAAILAADVVGYSRLMAGDEEGTHACLKVLRQDLIEPMIAERHGRVVKLTGDGILVEFASVVDAVECAIAIQKGVAERQGEEVPVDCRVAFRIGINIGDIIIEEGDIYGIGVNIAARLESIAEPGGICVSRTVYHHVQDKVKFGFKQAGEHRFKNIPEPVVVYRIVTDPGPIAKTFGLKRIGAPKGRWAALVTAAFVLLAAGGIAVWLQPWRLAVDAEATSYQTEPWELPTEPSIAVLPFENLSGDPEQAYFADGITNDIITDLSKFSTLFVIAANSSFRYKGRAVKAQDVARDLGVRYILEGSVQSIGRTLRINVNLIDATTGSHVWAERYERPAENLFAAQKEVTQHVAAVVGSNWGKLQRAELERIARIPTEDLQAYDLYLRGMAYSRRKTKEDNALARQMIEKAIEADPNYARATAECSLTYLNDIFNNWTDSREEWLQKAEDLARRAIEIDSAEPWGFVALGLVYQLKIQINQALPLFEEAHALNPNDYYVKEALGYALAYAGSAERGVELLEQARQLNPYQTEEHPLTLAMAYFFARRYQDATAAINRITRRHRSPTYWLYKAASHAQLGELDSARAAVAEALQLDPRLTLQGEHERRLALGLAPANAEHLTEALRKAGLPERVAP